MNWTVEYSREARKNLNDIFEHIAYSLKELEIARKQLRKIVKIVNSLDFMPYRHPIYIYEPFFSIKICSIAVGKYIVFYIPMLEDSIVKIVGITYGGRNMEYYSNSINRI